MNKNYAFRSLLIFGSEFAIIFVIFWAVSLYYVGLSELLIAGIALIFILIQYLIGPFIIQWIYRIDWMEPERVVQLYPNIAQIIDHVINKYGIKPPRFGVIHDGSPNAFTFGWTKNTARIVITDGILQLLDKEEQKGVVAHELGHVVHSDFIVMTIASAIPVLFYTLFRVLVYSRGTTRRRTTRGGDTNNAEALKYALAALCWIMYIVGTFVMLLLSRIREFWADDFAARETENANALSTALVKIAYGLLQSTDELSQSSRSQGGSSAGSSFSFSSGNNRIQYIKGLGIADRNTSKNLVYSAGGNTNNKKNINTNIIAKSAAWDLYTYWAKYYTVFSTHPLPANRINRLNQVSVEVLNKPPTIDLSPAKAAFEKEMGKSGLDEFIGELFVQFMPKLIFFGWLIAGIIMWATGFDFTGIPLVPFNNALAFLAFSFIVAGILQLLQNMIKYSNKYQVKTLEELITTIKVSPVRPVPAIVRGKVIGRGAPGLFWSEDVFIRDETALMYIDYDYGIGFINTLFGLFRAKKLQNKPIEVVGWYRRGPSPYVQVNTIQDLETGKKYRCRKRFIWQFVGFFLIVLGAVLWYFANTVAL